MRMEFFIYGIVLILAGMISGAILMHSYLATVYEELLQAEIKKQEQALSLLTEIGKALGFGYVILMEDRKDA